MDVDHKGACCTGETVIGHHPDHVWQTKSGHNTDDSQRDYELIESDASFLVLHGCHRPESKRYQQGNVPRVKDVGWVNQRVVRCPAVVP